MLSLALSVSNNSNEKSLLLEIHELQRWYGGIELFSERC